MLYTLERPGALGLPYTSKSSCVCIHIFGIFVFVYINIYWVAWQETIAQCEDETNALAADDTKQCVCVYISADFKQTNR